MRDMSFQLCCLHVSETRTNVDKLLDIGATCPPRWVVYMFRIQESRTKEDNLLGIGTTCPRVCVVYTFRKHEPTRTSRLTPPPTLNRDPFLFGGPPYTNQDPTLQSCTQLRRPLFLEMPHIAVLVGNHDIDGPEP